MLKSQSYSKTLKRILKPPVRTAAKVAVWLIIFFNFVLFHSKKNHLPALLANLCFNDSLVFKINPEILKYHITDPDSMPEKFFIWSGEWDRDIIPTDKHEKFITIRELFIDKKNYQDTQFYSFAMDQILKGEPLQRGDILLDSEKNITLYFEKYKKLFVNIKTNGFDPDLAPRIGVAIDRNGQLLYFRQGHHSLAIGKIMGIKNITVEIRAVHGTWLSKQIKRGSKLHILESASKGFKKLFD